MVDGHGQVGKAIPGVAGGIVRVDASRVATAREKTADNHDPSAERSRGHLGARLGERRPRHPGSRRDRCDGSQREPGRHPSQATRRIATATTAARLTATALTISTRVSVAGRAWLRHLPRSVVGGASHGLAKPCRDVAVEARALTLRCPSELGVKVRRHAKQQAPTRKRRLGTGVLDIHDAGLNAHPSEIVCGGRVPHNAAPRHPGPTVSRIFASDAASTRDTCTCDSPTSSAMRCWLRSR